MRHSSIVAATLLTSAGALVLGACGSSSSTSSTTSSAASSASTASNSQSVTAQSGSSFCTQLASAAAQLAHISSSFTSGLSAGATPDVANIKQLASAEAGVLDNLDNNAPSEIAAATHTLRTAFDQASAKIQSASSFQELGTAFTALATPDVRAAAQSITTYVQGCGLTSSTTST